LHHHQTYLTCNKHLSAGALVDEAGSISVDGSVFIGQDGATFVDGLTDDVDDTAEGLGTDGDQNWVTSVHDGLSTDETFSGVEGDGSDVVTTEMLGDFEDKSVCDSLNFESVENWGEGTLELDVDDSTNNL
jgi:hypothetical protein